MFWNNLKIALRNLRKNKLYAVINIAGLALGLAIYVFGGLLVKYESTHDLFFKNAQRTYTVGSIAAPDLNVGVDKMGSTFMAVGPILAAEVSDVDIVARTIGREMLITTQRASTSSCVSPTRRSCRSSISTTCTAMPRPWTTHRECC